MAQANQPVVPLFQISGEGKSVEIWLANDLPRTLASCRVAWSIDAEGKTLLQGEKQADALALDAVLVESIDLSAIPQSTPAMTVELKLSDATGKLLSRYRRDVFLKAWRLQDAVFKKK